MSDDQWRPANATATATPPQSPAPPEGGERTPPPPKGGVPWWVLLVAVLLTAGIAAGVAFALLSTASSTTTAQLAALTEANNQLKKQVGGLQAQVAVATAAAAEASAAANAVPVTEGPAAASGSVIEPNVTGQYATIKSVSAMSLTVDYVTMLTGAKAAAYAAAHGIPYDPTVDSMSYVFENQSAKLRTIPLSPSAKVYVLRRKNSAIMPLEAIAPSNFAAWYADPPHPGMPGDSSFVKPQKYWKLNVSGGKITRLEEFYQP